VITLDGNSYSYAIKFVGLEGELRFDSSNWDLLLHDGTTPGGRRFLNMTNSDARYQARSVELDGLLDFEPQQKGFLVRLGASSYRIRKMTVDTDNLVIENPQGYAGDTKFGLKPQIDSKHTWAESQSFLKEIDAKGGVRGKVTGDVTGNVTGNLTGNSSGTHTGAVDARGKTLLVDDDSIHLASLNEDVGEFILARGVPYGGIIMWSGAANKIPQYWYLCDGQNSTPDLRGRFIIGAGGDYAVNATGGAASRDVQVAIKQGGAHTHTGEVDPHALTLEQMPPHHHGNGLADDNKESGNRYPYGVVNIPGGGGEPLQDAKSGQGTIQGLTEDVGGGEAHSHGLQLEQGGAHTHESDAVAVDLRPPYYALCYIMKGV